MNNSNKRRVAGAAAFSATAIASLLGAQPASAEPQAMPPGITQACESRPAPDSPETLAFKSGFPMKWSGLRCSGAEEGSPADWWQKINP